MKIRKIEIIETEQKCCNNCVGYGEECESGYPWIFCKIRDNYYDKLDECGDEKGCSYFKGRKMHRELEIDELTEILDDLEIIIPIQQIKELVECIENHIDCKREIMSY